MNTKQTPEHEAHEALRLYAEWLYSRFEDGDQDRMDLQQPIIKAFQDRAELIDALGDMMAVFGHRPSSGDRYGIKVVESAGFTLARAKAKS